MPNLIVFDTNRRLTKEFTIAFARGVIRNRHTTTGKWEVKHVPIEQYLLSGMPANTDAVATLGILRGTGLMLKEAKAKGIDYYYMDHAYYNPGYGGKGYLRITKNGHACTTLRDVDSKAFDSFEKYSLQPWRPNAQRGKKILVLPPTDAVGWFFNDRDWEQRTVAKIREYMPDAEIVVRRKPGEPVVDERGFLLHLHTSEEVKNYPPLEEQLADSFCVVAYNSMVALQATLMGIPVITSGNSCCTRISFSVESLAKPELFDIEPAVRSKVVWWLAHNQWKRRSIEEGGAWEKLQEIY